MIEVFLYVNMVFIASMVVLVIFSKSPWAKVLSNRLLVTCLVVEIVLFAIYTNSSFALDVALAFAVLGFVDIQFLTVFLRKKGEL